MQHSVCMRIAWDQPEEQWSAWGEVMPHVSLFQTAFWKKVQENAGKTVRSLVCVNNEGGIVSTMLCIIEPLPLGAALIVAPRGPVFAESVAEDTEQVQNIIQAYQKALKERYGRAAVLRFEPAHLMDSMLVSQKPMLAHALQAIGARHVYDKQPAVTRMIDLQQSQDALLQAMKQKTRYNIRHAKKQSVRTEWISIEKADSAAIQFIQSEWWRLQQMTAERQGIHVQPKGYFDALLSTTHSRGAVWVGIAYAGEQVIAMNITIVCGDTMTYLFGASDYTQREAMAPYALQWEGIVRAQDQQLRYYDFYGIAPNDADEKHPLAGVTRFKSGFGGSVFEYIGTWELALNRFWYTIYRIVKYVR